MAIFFKKIIKNNKQITYLDLSNFSNDRDNEKSVGGMIFKALDKSNHCGLQTLIIKGNSSWFKNPVTQEDREENSYMLSQILRKHRNLKSLDLSDNNFSGETTMQLLEMIKIYQLWTLKELNL